MKEMCKKIVILLKEHSDKDISKYQVENKKVLTKMKILKFNEDIIELDFEEMSNIEINKP
jgi:bifunctional ADP-heptose synthase (sugar kinase/adenylyltransferase)